MERLPDGPNTTLKYLFNPLTEDFTTTYANDANKPITYTCPSMKISEFPTYLADHIAKHLAQKIVFKRGIQHNYEQDFRAVLQEITIIL